MYTADCLTRNCGALLDTYERTTGPARKKSAGTPPYTRRDGDASFFCAPWRWKWNERCCQRLQPTNYLERARPSRTRFAPVKHGVRSQGEIMLACSSNAFQRRGSKKLIVE